MVQELLLSSPVGFLASVKPPEKIYQYTQRSL